MNHAAMVLALQGAPCFTNPVAVKAFPEAMAALPEAIVKSAEKNYPASPMVFARIETAICDRESGEGISKDLKGRGTVLQSGDFTPRWRKLGARYKRVDDKPARDDGRVLVVPADGLGFGRSAFQLDVDAQQERLSRRAADGSLLWQSWDGAALLGGEVLADCFRFWSPNGIDFKTIAADPYGKSTQWLLLRAIVASYNAGPENVRSVLKKQSLAVPKRVPGPDEVTTGRDYSADVLSKRMLAQFGPLAFVEPGDSPEDLVCK